MRHRRRQTARLPAIAALGGEPLFGGGVVASLYYVCVLFFIRAAVQFCIYEQSQQSPTLSTEEGGRTMASVVVYARISTHEGRQHLATQLHACAEYAIKRGYKVIETYTDEASATDYRRRTSWRRMLADLARWQPRQRPKAIIAFALDRVIRSVRDYVDTQESLRELGVALVTIDGATGDLDTEGDVYRDLQLNILAAFAQFERDLIRKRVQAGVDRARADGKPLGRPQKAINAAAWANLPPGLSLRQRAAVLDVSRSTLGRAERSGALSQNPPAAEGPESDTPGGLQ